MLTSQENQSDRGDYVIEGLPSYSDDGDDQDVQMLWAHYPAISSSSVALSETPYCRRGEAT